MRRVANEVYPDLGSEGGQVYTGVRSKGGPDIPVPDRRSIRLVNVVCM